MRPHWKEQTALEIALEASRMQEVTFPLALVRLFEQTPRYARIYMTQKFI